MILVVGEAGRRGVLIMLSRWNEVGENTNVEGERRRSFDEALQWICFGFFAVSVYSCDTFSFFSRERCSESAGLKSCSSSLIPIYR